jgi:uncharacterized protein YlaI
MTTIKATCPLCGEVSLGPQDIELRIHPAGDERDFYAFTCPECDDRVRKPADSRIVRLLRTGGVEPIVPRPHPEPGPGDLAPLTHDDLLDFHQLLQRDDWFEALTSSRSR